jgi:hypothetical protein
VSVHSKESILERLSHRLWWVESLRDKTSGKTGIYIGGTGFLSLRPYHLRGKSLQNHKHVMGTTGAGKSNFLANYFVSLIKKGIPASLIDPHSDLAVDTLHHLMDEGYFDTEDKRRRILYIDFGAKDSQNRPTHFLPFNVLKSRFDKYQIARNFVETCRRVWPYLAEGAPQFENILLYSVILLIDNDLPITEIEEVLSNREYRDTLLERVTDHKVISFFQNRYDEWGRDAPLMRESTLNKISVLTFSPVLRYSLSQRENVLDFRKILDEGISVIFNLGGLDEETQKFLGSLLSIGFETAALSREDTGSERRGEYHLLLDEFSMFSASSETSLSRILSLCRKYGLFLVLAHQTFSQISERLRGALQNSISIGFHLGRLDAEKMSRQFGEFDSFEVKHTVTDEQAEERTHPMYFSVAETFEEWAKDLTRLQIGECYIKTKYRTEKVMTPRFPALSSNFEKRRELEEYYLERYFVRAEDALAPVVNEHQLQETLEETTVFPALRRGRKKSET